MEMKTKPTAKAGDSPAEAVKAKPGATFPAPSLVRLIGSSRGKKTVNSGFSALDFERGGWPNGQSNGKTLNHPPAPIGARGPEVLPPWDSLQALLTWPFSRGGSGDSSNRPHSRDAVGREEREGPDV